MAYLQENEWMLLNEVAYNIAFIYTVEQMKTEILDWMKMLIPYDAAVFASVEQGEGEFRLTGCTGNGLTDKQVETWAEETQSRDNTRWIIYSARNTAFRESDLLSEDARKTGSMYEKFYRPMNLYHSLGLCIVFNGEPIGLIKLYRSQEKGDFGLRDMFVLNQLQKHFAYRLYYEAKKGDTRYFFAKGNHEKLCRQYNLTQRESQLLDYAVKGMSNEDISLVMKISIHTVKKHFHSIYTKMNVSNRVQLLQMMPLSTNKINFDEL